MVAEPGSTSPDSSPETTAQIILNTDPYYVTRAVWEISGTASVALFLNGCAASALQTVFYPTSKTHKKISNTSGYQTIRVPVMVVLDFGTTEWYVEGM